MIVLIPSAGRRYLHIKYIKESMGVSRLVTTEISDRAPGIFTADVCYRVPSGTDPGFVDALLKICEKEKVNAILPMLDLDIDVLSSSRDVFENRGIKLLLSPKETIDVALDKLETASVLAEADIPSPETIIATEWDENKASFKLPILIKPRFPSKRWGGAYVISVLKSEDEVQLICNELGDKLKDFVFQEYLQGTELTVDFFCDDKGYLISTVPGERLGALSRAFSKNGGAISEGRIFHSEEIDQITQKLTHRLKFFGPANFQAYRLKNGEVKITEINPRVTGATVMTKAAGRDFFQWSIDLLRGKSILKPEDDFKEINMVSWTHPIFFEKSNIQDI